MERFFITSTGTGIGKTLITAALTHQLREAGGRVVACKPVASGIDPLNIQELASSDPAILARSLGIYGQADWLHAVSPFRFQAPLSPDRASAREGASLHLDEIVAFCRDAERRAPEWLLVEGVGGIMVPLTPQHTVLDWIKALEYPVLLVAGTYLGALSHTLTALRVLEHAQVPVKAVILSESEASPMPPEEFLLSLKPFVSHPMHIVPRIPPHAEPWRQLPPLLPLLQKGTS